MPNLFSCLCLLTLTKIVFLTMSGGTPIYNKVEIKIVKVNSYLWLN